MSICKISFNFFKLKLRPTDFFFFFFFDILKLVEMLVSDREGTGAQGSFCVAHHCVVSSIRGQVCQDMQKATHFKELPLAP